MQNDTINTSIIRQNHLLASIQNSKKIINLNVICYLATKYPIIKQIVVDELGFQLGIDYYVFLWTDFPLTIHQFRQLDSFVRVNHFPEIVQLTRKNKLAKNLNKMQTVLPKEYDFFPQTWLLPVDWYRIVKKHQKGKYYIVKPENSSQGKGIYIVDHPAKLDRSVNCVVQEYIASPLLIDGLKFDLRMYALVTCVNPLRIYLYKQGLARFATQKFIKPSVNNLQQHYVHLTNYAINKNNQNFVADSSNFSIGHKRLVSGLFNQDYYNNLFLRIGEIVIKSILSGASHLQNSYAQIHRYDPNSCFQLLGYDIIINSDHKPYLLEINQNPSLTADTPIDQSLKSQLVKDIFTIVSGGLVIQSNQKMEDRIRLKDKYEMSHLGKFQRIYPCKDLNETQLYDKIFMTDHLTYLDKFGINVKSVSTNKTNSKTSTVEFTTNPIFQSRDKMQKVYGNRSSKTSNNKKRLLIY